MEKFTMNSRLYPKAQESIVSYERSRCSTKIEITISSGNHLAARLMAY